MWGLLWDAAPSPLQDMEISVTELQTILNRIIAKREPWGGGGVDFGLKPPQNGSF